MPRFNDLLKISPTDPSVKAVTCQSLSVLTPVLVNLLQFLLIVFVIGGYHGAFLTLNALGSYLPDSFWSLLTQLGDTRVALAVLLFFCFKNPLLISKIFLASLLTSLIVQGIKQNFPIQRPFAVFPVDEFHLIGEALSIGSFPSGHSATIGVVVTLLLTLCSHPALKRWLIAAMLFIAGSRVMVGAHWPVDVMTGLMIGMLVGILVNYLVERWQLLFWPPLQWLVMLLMGYLAVDVFFDDAGYPLGHLAICLLTATALIRYAYQLYLSLPQQWQALRAEQN